MPEPPEKVSNDWPPPWAKRIRDFAAQIVPKNLTGRVTLHFSEGGPTRIELDVSLK